MKLFGTLVFLALCGVMMWQAPFVGIHIGFAYGRIVYGVGALGAILMVSRIFVVYLLPEIVLGVTDPDNDI